MAPRNRTRLNLRIVDESRRVPERALREAPEAGDRTGAFLRAWRERLGWTIDQVAWVLRIRLVYLEAIEADRFDLLPGRIYVTGFVRSYARLLGLDEHAVVRQLRREHPDIDKPRALVFPEPPAERFVPGGAMMAVGIMVAVIVYGGWYYQTATSRSERPSIASVPAHLVATADLPVVAPMQPPMRPPPARTVADASGISGSASERGSELAAAEPMSAASTASPASTAGGTGEASRGAPPRAGDTQPLQIPLVPPVVPPAEIVVAQNRTSEGVEQGGGTSATGTVEVALGEPAVTSNSERRLVAAPAAGALQAAGASPGPGYATTVPWQPPAVSLNEPGRRAAALSAPPAVGSGVLAAAPQLPSAEMVDAYAASLPPNMIPVTRGGPVAQTSAAHSASAAWARSVDRLPHEQWMNTGESPPEASGPVVLNAVEATWIEVREEDGQVVLGKLLQPGDSYTVPERPGLKLTTGNAGGLKVVVGGRPAPRLGPRGAVRRDIGLDQHLLLAGDSAGN